MSCFCQKKENVYLISSQCGGCPSLSEKKKRINGLYRTEKNLNDDCD
jgi:hypothetical protein